MSESMLSSTEEKLLNLLKRYFYSGIPKSYIRKLGDEYEKAYESLKEKGYILEVRSGGGYKVYLTYKVVEDSMRELMRDVTERLERIEKRLLYTEKIDLNKLYEAVIKSYEKIRAAGYSVAEEHILRTLVEEELGIKIDPLRFKIALFELRKIDPRLRVYRARGDIVCLEIS
ncbi:MAG: hypothetical protein DRJ52_03900 [Thermoprotei archaeon]|nr:MAG: hypothetical protein DRJ52_03900 [Thermoprotei archaeon]RLF00577.1 MAG: hypothetical protein DRJ63_02010 [Thermoprotei archaeon]